MKAFCFLSATASSDVHKYTSRSHSPISAPNLRVQMKQGTLGHNQKQKAIRGIDFLVSASFLLAYNVEKLRFSSKVKAFCFLSATASSDVHKYASRSHSPISAPNLRVQIKQGAVGHNQKQKANRGIDF